MNSNFRVRRATLDDIGQLTALWQSMHWPVEDLAKRVTEFQVAEDKAGKVAGALGMQISEKQARVHSEAFPDFSLADLLRPVLWDRVQSVANNHGLTRLWTQEQAPFYNHIGLAEADEAALQKLPAIWKSNPGKWKTLKLKEDLDTVMSLDKEFAIFMQSEKQRTERAFQQAKVLKVIATLIALTVLIIVIVGAFIIFKKHAGFPAPR